jgi:hypothetical protein
MFTATRSLFFSGALIFSIAASATAAPINYGNFNGVNPGDVDFLNVTEDSATDATPLYEAPIHLPNKLLFVPIGFASVASNGGSDTTNGVLTVHVRADIGQTLNFIIVSELGDFTLSGVGTSATSANIFSNVSALDLTPGTHGTISDSLDFSPVPAYTLPGASFDEFSGGAIIDLSGLAISEVFLTLDNTLTTSSEAGTTSFIQKMNVSIEHSNVPEPATLVLLAMSSLAAFRRRRG